MDNQTAICRAHTNIALIKYWGKRDEQLILPANSNLSLTLDALYTDTKVTLSRRFRKDQFILNHSLQSDSETDKISRFLDLFRQEAHCDIRAHIESINHVPTGAGLASSASAFAALAGACREAFNLEISDHRLSIFARQGSGSATRSIYGGFVEWQMGQSSDDSYAHPIDDGEWDVGMVIVVLNHGHKKIGSRVGMRHTVQTSPFFEEWTRQANAAIQPMKQAIAQHDVRLMGEIAEHNAMMMHATTLAANPPFTYFEPETLLTLDLVKQLRKKGLQAYYTMDAGPNVKILCPLSQTTAITNELKKHYGLDKLIIASSGPGIQHLDLLEE